MEQQKSKVLGIIQEERVRSERMRKLVNLHDTQKEREEKNFKKSQIEVKDLQRKLKLFELNLKLKNVAFDEEASGKVNNFEKRVQELVRTNLEHEKLLQGCYRSEREQETLLSQLRVQNEHLRNLVIDLSAKLRNIDGVFSDDVSFICELWNDRRFKVSTRSPTNIFDHWLNFWWLVGRSCGCACC
jgi:hypothetical protein